MDSTRTGSRTKNRPVSNSTTGRKDASTEPPSDAFAETCLIGSILLVSRVLDDIGAIVVSEDFHDPRKGMIFAASQKMHAAGKPVDAVLILDHMKALGKQGSDIGEELLTECIESVPHAAHAVYYAKIVAEKSQRRSLLNVGRKMVELASSELVEIDDAVAQGESSLANVLARRAGDRTETIGDILADALAGLSSGRSRGIPTGLSAIDNLIVGLVDGNLLIVAARPSIGKTALAVNIARNLIGKKIPVGFISLEQTAIEIGERLLSSESRVSTSEMRSNTFTEAQRDGLMQAAQVISEMPLHIDECQYRGIAAIEASGRLMVRRNGIKLLIVDYLQLISGQDRRDAREQEVAEVSRRLKWLAKSLSIPVIALAQLNRENEKRTDKRPKLSDLRESGSIEQDADVVILLHREEFYDPMNNPGQAVAIIAKNRNGRTGEAALQFQGHLMQFRDLAPGHIQEPTFGTDGDSDRDEWGLPRNP